MAKQAGSLNSARVNPATAGPSRRAALNVSELSAIALDNTPRSWMISVMNACLQGISMAIPSLNVVTHFTHYTVGHAHLGLYAFFTMIMFGAMYYILPRVVGWEWPSARLIRWHFWLVAIGIGMMVVVLTLGGLLQGLALLDPDITFMASLDYTKPWLFLRSISGLLLTAGHIVFAVSFTLLLLKAGATRTEPTLFATDQDRQPEPLNA